MSVERLDYLLKQGVQVPFVPNELTEFASKLVVMNLAWHADPDGYVWVSDRTQALELHMSRSTVWVARRLFEREKWLLYTGNKKQKGVKVYKLVIPGYLSCGSAVQTTNKASVLDSGLTSGSDSGLPSGSDSGLPSGSHSGLAVQTKKEIKQFEIKEKEQTQKNNLDHLPENVRERIKQNRRSRGIYGEQTLGEAVQDIFKNIEPPNQQDKKPF
jgi:hypothetical protein